MNALALPVKSGPWSYAGTAQLSLEVPVQILIRVELQRIGQQIEHFDLRGMCLHPGRHFFGMVCPEVVQYQKDFLPMSAAVTTLIIFNRIAVI